MKGGEGGKQLKNENQMSHFSALSGQGSRRKDELKAESRRRSSEKDENCDKGKEEGLWKSTFWLSVSLTVNHALNLRPHHTQKNTILVQPGFCTRHPHKGKIILPLLQHSDSSKETLGVSTQCGSSIKARRLGVLNVSRGILRQRDWSSQRSTLISRICRCMYVVDVIQREGGGANTYLPIRSTLHTRPNRYIPVCRNSSAMIFNFRVRFLLELSVVNNLGDILGDIPPRKNLSHFWATRVYLMKVKPQQPTIRITICFAKLLQDVSMWKKIK